MRIVSTLSTILCTLALTSSAFASGPAVIISPANGTAVMPGDLVPFNYDGMAEYTRTSWNISIWLYTSDPTQGLFSGSVTGVSMGVWSFSTSFNPYPPNPRPPAQLRIPDFRKFFLGDKSTANAPLWLSVYEEWTGETGAIGAHISYATTQLIYNVTSS